MELAANSVYNGRVDRGGLSWTGHGFSGEALRFEAAKRRGAFCYLDSEYR